MSKLVGKIKGSKLKDLAEEDSKSVRKEKGAQKIKHREFPRSYRFDPEIMNMLKDTLAKINEISPKKVSEARLVKALILISKDIDEKKILKALKEVW